jgi:4'-phosphopantetheinyl transferase
MAEPMLDVQRWPASGPISFAAPGLLLAAIVTPETTRRDDARRLVRAVLRDILGAQLDCAPAAVPLVFAAGEAPRLDMEESSIGVSVSHEPGLSLLAIRLDGSVGIDLMRPETPDASGDIASLARDYLGPEIARRIAVLPVAEQPLRFAEAWTRFEAGLKCLRSGLTEWTPALQQRLNTCRYFGLQLPPGFVGAVAVSAASSGRYRYNGKAASLCSMSAIAFS